jgi:phage tail sheath gpL-like
VPSDITAGDTYTLIAKRTNPARYVATGGDTATTLATELASLIDADADFIATSSGAEITVTHASNNVPFTLSESVTRGPILFFPVTIQEAT